MAATLHGSPGAIRSRSEGSRSNRRVGATWKSAEVNRYYYGVGAADATATRPLYEPDAGLGLDLGFTVAYPFAERHTLRFEAVVELVSDEVSGSPIVGRSSFGRIGAGYLFRF